MAGHEHGGNPLVWSNRVVTVNLGNLVPEICTSFLHKNLMQVHAISGSRNFQNTILWVLSLFISTTAEIYIASFWYQIPEGVSPP